MKRQFKEFKCVDCEKSFTVKGDAGFWYRPPVPNSLDKEFKPICSNCMDKWHKRWEVKNIEVIPSDNYSSYRQAKVTFKDGRIENITYDGVGKNDNIDAPDEFWSVLAEYRQKYFIELQKKEISNIEFVEGFDDNILKVETNGGLKLSVRYKYKHDGSVLLDPNVEIPDYLQPQIYAKFREHLVSQR